MFKALTQTTFVYSSEVALFKRMQKSNTYLAQRYFKKCVRKVTFLGMRKDIIEARERLDLLLFECILLWRYGL